jgi:hypothetical protein
VEAELPTGSTGLEQESPAAVSPDEAAKIGDLPRHPHVYELARLEETRLEVDGGAASEAHPMTCTMS